MNRDVMGIAFIFALLQTSVASAQCPTFPDIRSGEATFYTFADGGGGCLFDPTPDDLMVGAMNAVDYGSSVVCGECVSLTGPNGNILIRIVDFCPECGQGDIDLSPLAFSLIADTARGRVPITWQVVPCMVAGPIQYHFKDGSNQWWTAVQVRNHRYPILMFEYLDANGTYQSVSRTTYNYFVQSPGMGPGPYTFRVTDVYGDVLEDTGIPGGDNTTATGHAQFPLCDGLVSVRNNSSPGQVVPATPPLLETYPNPFNPSTMVRFHVPRPGNVELRVTDVLGREVALLAHGMMAAGDREVRFDASGLPSGVYFCRLQAGEFVAVNKLLLMR